MVNLLNIFKRKQFKNIFTLRQFELDTYEKSIVDDISNIKFILDNINKDNNVNDIREILCKHKITNTSHEYCSKDNRTISNHSDMILNLESLLKRAKKVCKKNLQSTIATKLEMYIHPLELTVEKLINNIS